MTLLKWKPAFSLGIPSVDHEHRELIAMINGIYENLEGQNDPEAVEMCLGDIHAGISAHFALEERFMREAGYGEYEAHKDQHEDLLDQISDMIDRFVDDPQAGRRTLQQELTDWFGVHFATFDARLHHELGDSHSH
jgi:hemerythrin